MEEKYFLYFEEIDWAIRSNRAGWQIAFCPSAKIYHKGGSTIKGSGGNSLMMDFYYARNRILLARKFFPYTQPVLLMSFGWFVLRRILQGQFDRIPMLLKIIMRPDRFFGN
jgi:GT2 family glycosyltransferase